MAKKKKGKSASAVTIYDVGRKAGVSVVTVSRVFNDYPHVSPRMKARVLEAARSIGFSPKLVAKPRRLAVVVGHLDQLHGGGYKGAMLMHLIGSAARQGYAVEFIPAENMELAVMRSVDGVIEFGLTSAEIDCLNQLPDIPVVLINKRVSSPRRWSSVCSDHHEEARLATEYLLRHGHRRIALILDEDRGWSAEQRMRGYEETMQSGSGVILPLLSAEALTAEAMADRMIADRCTGFVNLSDNVGLALSGVLLRSYGKQVPQDLSVVGLEEESISRHLAPPMTTIEQPLSLIADAAITGLLQEIDQGRKSFHRMLPSRLIERESVKKLARKTRAPTPKLS